MSKLTLFRLKNQMLLSNFISNAIGVMMTIFLENRLTLPDSLEAVYYSRRLQLLFIPISFAIPFVLNFIYELPIRRYLNNCFQAQSTPPFGWRRLCSGLRPIG